eukprot:1033905-Rhodomonas_salina.2
MLCQYRTSHSEPRDASTGHGIANEHMVCQYWTGCEDPLYHTGYGIANSESAYDMAVPDMARISARFGSTGHGIAGA